jgi:hypothetical protein
MSGRVVRPRLGAPAHPRQLPHTVEEHAHLGDGYYAYRVGYALQALVDVLTSVRPTQDLQPVVTQLGPGATGSLQVYDPLVHHSVARLTSVSTWDIIPIVMMQAPTAQRRSTPMQSCCSCSHKFMCGGTMQHRSSQHWMCGLRSRPPQKPLRPSPARPEPAQTTQVGKSMDHVKTVTAASSLHLPDLALRAGQ